MSLVQNAQCSEFLPKEEMLRRLAQTPWNIPSSESISHWKPNTGTKGFDFVFHLALWGCGYFPVDSHHKHCPQEPHPGHALGD